MRISPTQLAAALAGIIDDAATTDNSNMGSAGRWREFAEAAEAIAGTTSTANDNIAGYMLRSAVALEGVAGTSGTNENSSYHGLLKRIVDALEVQAGGVTDGSFAQRMAVAAAAATFVFDPASLFANGEQGVFYDVSDLSTMFQNSDGTLAPTVGTAIGYLGDKSGRGNHALQATASPKPVLRQDTGGRYYLEFDGSVDVMNASFAISQPISRVSAIRQTTWASGDAFFGGPSATACALFQTGVSPNFALYSGATAAGNNTLPIGTNGVVSEVHNGASSSLTVNNGTATTGNAGTTLPGGIRLGTSTTSYANFRLYGLVMINRLLTTNERTKLRQWMADKAGVTL